MTIKPLMAPKLLFKKLINKKIQWKGVDGENPST
jgi:hypothetical protein